MAVDEATGMVEVVHVWAAHDCGRAINPLAVEGQVQGAVAQGIAAALFSWSRSSEQRQVPQEAIIGISYAVASAATILALSKSSSEGEHLKDMLVGNILAVSWAVFGLAALPGFRDLRIAGLGYNGYECAGGSTLLAQTWRPGEESRLQGAHDVVVLVGPSHYVAFGGVAVAAAGARGA